MVSDHLYPRVPEKKVSVATKERATTATLSLLINTEVTEQAAYRFIILESIILIIDRYQSFTSSADQRRAIRYDTIRYDRRD